MGLGHALEGAGLLLVAGGAVDLAIDLSLLCQQGGPSPGVALVLEVIAQAGERIPIDEIEPATIGGLPGFKGAYQCDVAPALRPPYLEGKYSPEQY
ncbi:hypothetical protein QPK60_10625 [Aeromonas caviae]|uniref:hypothetical protein n=1 Tax=Aeromonas caviae TaxID=648 RepID=UPI00254046D1|nr:hypothetical protein [Aeromonas caviae]MDK3164596.1 hypothetical protein [Aeromonas caviae]